MAKAFSPIFYPNARTPCDETKFTFESELVYAKCSCNLPARDATCEKFAYGLCEVDFSMAPGVVGRLIREVLSTNFAEKFLHWARIARSPIAALADDEPRFGIVYFAIRAIEFLSRHVASILCSETWVQRQFGEREISEKVFRNWSTVILGRDLRAPSAL